MKMIFVELLLFSLYVICGGSGGGSGKEKCNCKILTYLIKMICFRVKYFSWFQI